MPDPSWDEVLARYRQENGFDDPGVQLAGFGGGSEPQPQPQDLVYPDLPTSDRAPNEPYNLVYSTSYNGFQNTGYRPPTYGQFPLQDNQWIVSSKPENYLGPVADQVVMAYPGVNRENLPAMRQVKTFVPSTELGLGERGMYTEPAHSQYPQGSIHVYGHDLPVELHEYSHAMSVPVMNTAQWNQWKADLA